MAVRSVRIAAAVAVCFVVLAGFGRWMASGAQAATDPVPGLMKSAADVARGRALFIGTCGAYCHKLTPGPGDAPFLFGCTFRHGGSDQEIFDTITHGVPGTRMVAFAGAFPDDDIWRIIAYLKSTSVCKNQ